MEIYPDDIFLAFTSTNYLEQLVQKWNDRLMQHGLRLNLNKTEFLTTDPHETSTITICGNDLPRTKQFKYLGSTLSGNGELRYGITSRINATWMEWLSTTGVICDRRINERLKSIYGSITIKDNDRRLAVMEARFDHIRN